MNIVNFFFKNRNAFAISMVFCSGPLNYAIRDGIGLAPNSTAFSTLFMFGALFLVFPFRNLKKLYRNDTPLIPLALIYIVVTLLYMLVYHVDKPIPITFVLYDMIVIIIVLYFLFFLMTVREHEIRMNFLKISITIAFLGCLGLLIYVMLNPSYIIGQRLAISYGDSSEGEAMGNPHTFGRGAFFGLVSALLYLKYEKKKIYRLFTYGTLLVFFAVLILSQAMSSIISGFLFFFLYAWNNHSFASIFANIRRLLTKWYVWVLIILGVIKGIDIFQKNEVIFELGYRVIERRVEKLVGTFLPSADEEIYGAEEVEDASAMGRVATLKLVKEQVILNLEEGEYLKLLFGNGYFALYVDVPIIEVFNSYGLLGFLLFGTLFWQMILYCLREMKNPSSIIGEFAAYGFIYFFVFTFTNGLIMDYTRWTFFILVCRFMPSIPIYKNSQKI